MQDDPAKSRHNAEVTAALHKVLRSKSWVEKIRSIERMNIADRIAKDAMKKTLAKRTKLPPSG